MDIGSHTFEISVDTENGRVLGYTAELNTSVNTSVQGWGFTVAEAIIEAVRLAGSDIEVEE